MNKLIPAIMLLVLVPLMALADDLPLELDLGEIELVERKPSDSIEVVVDPPGIEPSAESLGSLAAHTVSVLHSSEFGTAQSLPDVLERIPGVDLKLVGGFGQLSSAQIRGSRSSQVLVLLDGQPVSQGPADISTIPLGAVDSIEVLRGPEAARFGHGALGGVVNIVTVKQHGGDAGSSFQEAGTSSIETMAGSHGRQSVSATTKCSELSLFVSSSSAENDYSYTRADGSTGIRGNNEAAQNTLWASWHGGLGTSRLGLSSLDRGLAGSTEFPTLSAGLSSRKLWYQTASDTARLSLGLSRTRFSDPNPYLHRGEIKAADTKSSIQYAYGSMAGFENGWGFRASLDQVGSSSYGEHTRAGMDIAYASHVRRGGWVYSFETAAITSSDIGLSPSARAGLAKQVSRNSDVYISTGYSARHPSFDELYLADMGSIAGNPELDPESVYSIEIGSRARFGAASLQGAVFYSKYDESIIFAPVSGYLTQAINTGPASVGGMELALSQPMGNRLELRSAFTWLPLAEFESGIPLVSRSEHHINSQLMYSAKTATAAINFDYTSATPADLFGNLVINPRSLVGVELSKGFGSQQLELTVTNLFDESTRDAWNYPLPGREFTISWRTTL